MLSQERKHLEFFNNLGEEFRIRPTLLMPFWHVAGWSVGVGTALLGKEAAMACTEAVETVVGNHYNDQLRTLATLSDENIMSSTNTMEDEPDFTIPIERTRPQSADSGKTTSLEDFRKIIKESRDEELEHLDTAIEQDAMKAPAYFLLSTLIQWGCQGAIQIAKKI